MKRLEFRSNGGTTRSPQPTAIKDLTRIGGWLLIEIDFGMESMFSAGSEEVRWKREDRRE